MFFPNLEIEIQLRDELVTVYGSGNYAEVSFSGDPNNCDAGEYDVEIRELRRNGAQIDEQHLTTDELSAVLIALEEEMIHRFDQDRYHAHDDERSYSLDA